MLQAQQAPALPYAKVVGRPGTGSYPAPSPDPTTHKMLEMKCPHVSKKQNDQYIKQNWRKGKTIPKPFANSSKNLELTVKRLDWLQSLKQLLFFNFLIISLDVSLIYILVASLILMALF